MRIALSLMVWGLAWISGQQAPQRDSTDRLARPVTSISGVVVEPGTQPVPLHRVAVTLRGPSLGAGRLAVTDVDGKFVFPGLPAGNFTLEAVRPGYVRTFYGSTLLGKGPGLVVALREGEAVSDLTIQMLRGGVVTGTVRDAYGRPQSGAEVSLVPLAARTGLPDAGHVITVRTEGTGSYRTYGLIPGRYRIVVQPGFNYNGAAQYSRRQLDALMVNTPPQIDVQMGPAAHVGYAPVFFPGTVDVRAAGEITVDVGEEQRGIDVAMQFVPMTRLEGRVVAPSGLSVKDLELSIESSSLMGLELRSYLGTRPAAGVTIPVRDGSFQRSALTPGHYRLVAQATANRTVGSGTLWGLVDLEVTGQDVLSVVVELQWATTVAGTIDVWSGSSNKRLDLPVVLRSSNGDAKLARRTVAQSDGSFSFPDVIPGQYWIAPDPSVGGDWREVGITLDGADLIDVPLTIGAGQSVSSLRLSVSNLPSLTGRIIDPVGRPAIGFVIVVYSTDKNQWRNDRRIYIARPAQNGQYAVPALPMGEYLVSGAPDVDSASLRDPEFLEAASPSALKIAIDPGRTHHLDLQIPGRSALDIPRPLRNRQESPS
jgi:hypothetical protein